MTLTLDLSPALIARAEQRAAREGRTVQQLIEQALQSALDTNPPVAVDRSEPHAAQQDERSGWLYEDVDGRPLPFPVFYGGGGFPPGVDPCSNASLLAAADAEEDEKYIRIAVVERPDA